MCGKGYDTGHLWRQIAGRVTSAARCEVVWGRIGSPLGVRLTWGDALGGAGVLSSPRHCSMHGHAVQTPPAMHAFTIRCSCRARLFWVAERLGCVCRLCAGCTIGI